MFDPLFWRLLAFYIFFAFCVYAIINYCTPLEAMRDFCDPMMRVLLEFVLALAVLLFVIEQILGTELTNPKGIVELYTKPPAKKEKVS
jgi:hypothetical protein